MVLNPLTKLRYNFTKLLISSISSRRLPSMNDIQSDIELLLHIAHHQRYWKKRIENEEVGTVWSRQQYHDYVMDYLKTPPNVENFLTCWRDNPVPIATPNRRKQFSNPNERELHEKDAQDREKEQNIREIKERFLINVKKEQKKKSKADKRQDTSDSDTSVEISGASLGVRQSLDFMKEKVSLRELKGEGKTKQGMEG